MSTDALMTTPPVRTCGSQSRTTGWFNSVRSVLHRLQTRIRCHGVCKTGTYLLFVVLAERCGLQLSRRFEFDRDAECSPGHPPDGFNWSVAGRPEHLTVRDRDFLRDYGEEKWFLTRLAEGERCLIIRTTSGDLASVCWFRTYNVADGMVASPHAASATSNSNAAGIIQRCFTRYEYRGLDLYSWSLQHIASSDVPEIGMKLRRLFIECSPFNHASDRGITRAGFVPVSTMLSFRGAVWYSIPVKSTRIQRATER